MTKKKAKMPVWAAKYLGGLDKGRKDAVESLIRNHRRSIRKGDEKVLDEIIRISEMEHSFFMSERPSISMFTEYPMEEIRELCARDIPDDEKRDLAIIMRFLPLAYAPHGVSGIRSAAFPERFIEVLRMSLNHTLTEPGRRARNAEIVLGYANAAGNGTEPQGAFTVEWLRYAFNIGVPFESGKRCGFDFRRDTDRRREESPLRNLYPYNERYSYSDIWFPDESMKDSAMKMAEFLENGGTLTKTCPCISVFSFMNTGKSVDVVLTSSSCVKVSRSGSGCSVDIGYPHENMCHLIIFDDGTVVEKRSYGTREVLSPLTIRGAVRLYWMFGREAADLYEGFLSVFPGYEAIRTIAEDVRMSSGMFMHSMFPPLPVSKIMKAGNVSSIMHEAYVTSWDIDWERTGIIYGYLLMRCRRFVSDESRGILDDAVYSLGRRPLGPDFRIDFTELDYEKDTFAASFLVYAILHVIGCGDPADMEYIIDYVETCIEQKKKVHLDFTCIEDVADETAFIEDRSRSLLPKALHALGLGRLPNAKKDAEIPLGSFSGRSLMKLESEKLSAAVSFACGMPDAVSISSFFRTNPDFRMDGCVRLRKDRPGRIQVYGVHGHTDSPEAIEEFSSCFYDADSFSVEGGECIAEYRGKPMR